MSIEQIIPELKKLSHTDKLLAMQVLLQELVAEESNILIPNVTYEIYTPYGNEEGAQTLYECLLLTNQHDTNEREGVNP